MTSPRGRDVERAYGDALATNLVEGACVLDLGGDDGIRAVQACHAGARRVYSVHAKHAMATARDIVNANGCASRVEIVSPACVAHVSPAADVVVARIDGGSLVHGASLLHAGGWPATAVRLPLREQLWMTLVRADAQYALHASPWHVDDWCLSASRRAAMNTWSPLSTPHVSCVDARVWATLDYASDGAHTLGGSLEWTVGGSAIAHGIAIWPDVTFVDGLQVPGSRTFFPWPQPMALEEGDRVAVTIRVHSVGPGETWSWMTTREPVRGRERLHFVQSTFLGALRVPAALGMTRPELVPTLGEDGLIDRRILGLLQAGTAPGAIARTLTREFPLRVSSLDQGRTRVDIVCGRYADLPAARVPDDPGSGR